MELLIHIGIDTVELKGKHFEKLVRQGDKIKKGTKIVSFDIDQIKKAGYDPTVCVIVSNTPSYRTVAKVPAAKADADTDIILIENN